MGIINCIKGFFIGIALVVPGLSGSMFAVVVGLYDKILDSVNHFTKDIKRSVLFLAPVLIGVAFGILSSTKLVLWVCEEYIFQSYSFFIGLVLGSIPLVSKKIRQKAFQPAKLFISLLGLLTILFISYLASSLSGGNAETYVAMTRLNGIADFFVILFAGIFSCSLMAIPGVSGSIMLMLINQYGTVYNAVGQCVDMLKYIFQGDMVSAANAFSSVLIVIPFLLGAVIGFVLIAKALGYLLKRFESEVYYGVLGLVTGAVITLAKDGVYADFLVGVSKGFTGIAMSVLLVAIFVVVGYLCTVFLDKSE